ncbi:HNH endonuclease [Pseudoduganella sp. LjRoot289]|uniref:HNH endonuclease n=1 Tax=Pseudoduganella sp. LjRoot289 TaxID=3342314 RepID=UPI003ECCC51D
MPFTPAIREDVLVKSHRRCCVCHKFAGLAANVHHINPEAQGGSNSIENAICLCYECHADAGHYNPQHPLGIKYSPEELRKQRDQWWQICQGGGGDLWVTAAVYGKNDHSGMKGTFDVADEIKKAQAFLKKIEPLINSIFHSLRLQDSPVRITNEAFNGIERYRYFSELNLGVNHPERLFNGEFSARRSAIYGRLRELAQEIAASNYIITFDMLYGNSLAKYQNDKFLLDENDKLILQKIKILMQSLVDMFEEFSRTAY